jgi:drug/metabolite transporter (DMT)-like permease
LSRRGVALFAAMSVIWGIPYLLIKVADGGVSVPVLVWARVTIGALILVPLALAQGAWRPEQRAVLRAHWVWLVAYSVTEIVGPWALLSTAERRLPSSTSGLLVASVPIIGAVLAWLSTVFRRPGVFRRPRVFRRQGGERGGDDRISAIRAAGLAMGFGGVVLLAGHGAGHGDLGADAEVLLTALGYAAGPMIANRKLTDVPGIAANAACLLLAAVIYTPAAALTWPHAMPSASVLAALAALGAVCTAAGLVGYFWLIAEIGAARATVVTYVNPAIAVALGAGVLGEPLTPVTGVSFLLILAGSVLATRVSLPAGGRSRRRPSDPAPGT